MNTTKQTTIRTKTDGVKKMTYYVKPMKTKELMKIMDRLNKNGILTSTDLASGEICILSEKVEVEKIKELLVGLKYELIEGEGWHERYGK